MARPEKPHIGNCAVPFMKSTTRWLLTSWSMRCCDVAHLGNSLPDKGY